MYKIFQKKDGLSYKPWFMGNSDVAKLDTTLDSSELWEGQTFEEFCKAILRPGDMPLKGYSKEGCWKGNEYPCFACTDTGRRWEHNESIDCPFCKGTGGTSKEQLEYCYRETYKLLKKQEDDHKSYLQKIDSILNKLSPEEQELIEGFFSCTNCC